MSDDLFDSPPPDHHLPPRAVADALPRIELTISVRFERSAELAAALTTGWRLEEREEEHRLLGPNGESAILLARPNDAEFADVVSNSASARPSKGERRAMREAPILAMLSGLGGSASAAHAMLAAGAAIVRAGGSGVLVHNSGLGHVAGDWLALADQPGEYDGPHWAFVTTVRSDGGERYDSVGMHCLGLRDVTLHLPPLEELPPDIDLDELAWNHVNNFLGYVEAGPKPVVDGDVVGGQLGPAEPGEPGDELAMVPMFRAHLVADDFSPAGTAQHNPYGRYRLTPLDPDDPESTQWKPQRNADDEDEEPL